MQEKNDNQFKNGWIEESIEKMKTACTNSMKPIKELGIDVSESAIKQHQQHDFYYCKECDLYWTDWLDRGYLLCPYCSRPTELIEKERVDNNGTGTD